MKSILPISSIQGNYNVSFIDSLNDLINLIKQENDKFLIIDRNVFEIFKTYFTELDTPIFQITATENSKKLGVIEELSSWLIEKGAHKQSTLIGVGGGVIQDLVTFLSNIFHRGIDYLYVPTTLLSQADSCIGSKCALNVGDSKNQLGIFKSPKDVIICSNFLEYLPVEELKSGYGEILKLSITGENQFYNVFKKSIEKNGFSLVDVVELIRHSLLAKKPIIELDEHETDLRRILNYGHSFGHAIEAITRGEITHGDAIVFGMDLINFIGVKKKITREEFAEEFHQFVAKNFLHVKIPSNLQAIQLLEEVRKDKKRTHEFMNFIIPKDLGELKVVSCKLDEELVSMINEYLDECIFDRY